MTIVSHRYKFIFLKTHKTAGTSIEQWIAPHLGWRDLIATAPENRIAPVSFLSSPNAVSRWRRQEKAVKSAIWRFAHHLRRPRQLAKTGGNAICQHHADFFTGSLQR